MNQQPLDGRGWSLDRTLYSIIIRPQNRYPSPYQYTRFRTSRSLRNRSYSLVTSKTTIKRTLHLPSSASLCAVILLSVFAHLAHHCVT